MRVGHIPKAIRKRWNSWRDYYFSQIISAGARIEKVEQISDTLVKITIIPIGVRPKRKSTPTTYELYNLVPPYLFTVYTNRQVSFKPGQVISGDLAYKLLTQF